MSLPIIIQKIYQQLTFFKFPDIESATQIDVSKSTLRFVKTTSVSLLT